MTKKKLFAITMALLLVVTIPLAVLAETYDLSKGSITIEAREDGQYVSQDNGVQEEKQTTKTVIKQDKSESETTSNTITIKAGEKTNDDGSKEKLTAEVTISGVDIDVSNTGDVSTRTAGEAAISTGGEGNVNIELDWDNTLRSGYDHAGLEKNNGGNLTIGDKDDNGALTAVGGRWGAGIGGGYRGSGSDITITGSNVTASGGHAGAGIGGGGGGDASNITITDSNVTASGGAGGAGIGGGNDGDVSNITITDSNVTASGGGSGAGIGGGVWGAGSNITLTDSNVTASGGSSGAGIGGGAYSGGSNITITDSNVTASGGTGGAGIGGGFGQDGNGADITVSGDSMVKVSGGKNAADIGGGKYGNGEIAPDTSELGKNGSISYFAPDADKSKDTPERLLHKKDGNVETHTVTSVKSTTAATCTQPGSITYLCGCGEEVTQSISPLGHDREYYEGKTPTCTEAGWKAYYTCKRCDYSTYEALPIDSDNHDREYHEGKTPTCTETGWNEYYTCKRCGYSTRGDDLPIDPDNHDLEHHDAKAPTCTEDGWEEYDTCKRTGCDYTTYQKIDRLNHSFTNYVYQNDATCLEDGNEIATCDHTGCTETDKRTAKGTAMGHSFTNYVYQDDATCLEDGNEIATCDHTGCTETDERTAKGTATGHSFTDYVSNRDATYTQDGTETAQCDHGCGETDTRTVEGSRLPLYRVTDENGKSIIHKANYSGSTLTITAELDGAILTGSTLALPVLQARGITTVVFVTNGRASTFELADLLAKGEGIYALTHAGENVTFLLNEEDIGSILK